MANRVVVVGGGNAALCAAMAARDEGAEVVVLERAPRAFRGGNSRHTRNLRCLRTKAQPCYEFEEFMADLVGVTGKDINRELAALTIRDSEEIAEWMELHGARWQPALKGTLGLSRTNRFFLGGGKALMNAYYQHADASGVQIRYESPATGLATDAGRCTGVIVGDAGSQTRISADAVVVAAGGFEANREWLAEYWGPAAQNFVVRGTPFNDGSVLRLLLDAGARSVGEPRGVHAIAVDARSPAYDGGIVTRLDAIPIGICVNSSAQRFYDEGEDSWPKRYATWGRLIAAQPDQVAYAIYDAKVATETIPGLFPPVEGSTVSELAVNLGIDPGGLTATVEAFNAACQPGEFDLSRLDSSRTDGLTPPKSHWARPIDTPPFYGYPLRPGITFTYLGVAVDREARVQWDGGQLENVFAAGEIMSGNILTTGYLAGFGMTIGSVWGRIAGREAAHA